MVTFNLFDKNITSSTPLIFLDIDGVIHEPFEQGRIGNAWLDKSIGLINTLIEETGAKVVITTYRTHYIGFPKVLHDLKSSGLKAKVVDYIIYPIPGENKQTFIDQKDLRINDYIKVNKLNNYSIIDDYTLFQKNPVLRNRFVQVNPANGFSKHDYNNVKKLLHV